MDFITKTISICFLPYRQPMVMSFMNLSQPVSLASSSLEFIGGSSQEGTQRRTRPGTTTRGTGTGESFLSRTYLTEYAFHGLSLSSI